MDTFVYIVFFVVVPAGLIYLKIKKKLSIGFVVGTILTSMLFSLLVVATIKESKENIVEKFVRAINQKRITERFNRNSSYNTY